jgi:hypothetical protein
MDTQRLFKSTPRASAREDGQENCARRTSLFSEKLSSPQYARRCSQMCDFCGLAQNIRDPFCSMNFHTVNSRLRLTQQTFRSKRIQHTFTRKPNPCESLALAIRAKVA